MPVEFGEMLLVRRVRVVSISEGVVCCACDGWSGVRSAAVNDACAAAGGRPPPPPPSPLAVQATQQQTNSQSGTGTIQPEGTSNTTSTITVIVILLATACNRTDPAFTAPSACDCNSPDHAACSLHRLPLALRCSTSAALGLNASQRRASASWLSHAGLSVTCEAAEAAGEGGGRPPPSLSRRSLRRPAAQPPRATQHELLPLQQRGPPLTASPSPCPGPLLLLLLSPFLPALLPCPSAPFPGHHLPHRLPPLPPLPHIPSCRILLHHRNRHLPSHAPPQPLLPPQALNPHPHHRHHSTHTTQCPTPSTRRRRRARAHGQREGRGAAHADAAAAEAALPLRHAFPTLATPDLV